MEKKLILIACLAALIVAWPATVRAELTSGQSARLFYTDRDALSAVQNSDAYYTLKKLAIKRVLSRKEYQDEHGNPPPVMEALDEFIDACKTFDLDCYLLPSIAGVESGFGRATAAGTHNAFGWGRGLTPFKTWGDGVLTVGRGLRENYIDKGLKTIADIGARYCEGETWAGKVQYFKRQFEDEESKIPRQIANPV